MSDKMVRLGIKMDALAQWHQKIALFPLIGRLAPSRAFMLIAVLVGLFAAFANYDIRQSQYQVWQANKQITFLDETPLFSTTDASYFVGLARQYKQTGDELDFQKKRLYPHNEIQLAEAPPKDSAFDFPLLSVLIASFSADDSTQTLLKTAHALLPILGFMMALGILLAFGASGFWLEGAVAAIGAGLAPTFLMRSSVGRIDTDILNLGFFYAVLGLTIFAGRAASLRAAISWTLAAAVMLQLFFWWYDKAEFGFAFTIGLVWLSAVTSRSWQRPLILGVLFLLVSGLAFKTIGISSDSSYFVDTSTTGALIFPNTFKTITELRIIPFAQIMTGITAFYGLGVFGVLGLAIFAFRHPVLAVVYGPASLFALANFLVGNRAVFYSAPMIWFGVGFLAILLVRLALIKAPQIIAKLRDAEMLASGLVVALIMGSVFSFHKSEAYVPSPSFPKEIMRGFAAAKDNLPETAVIATWWDYGYASMLFNDYATLHDGGAQSTPVTHYFARAILAESQRETHAILRNLAQSGLTGIQQNSASFEAAEAHILGPNYQDGPPVYLVLTKQMAGWSGSISKLGLWDTKTGQPINAEASANGPILAYTNLQCEPGERPDAPVCNGSVFDLAKGTVAGQPALSEVTQATDGKIEGRNPLQRRALNSIHISEVRDEGVSVLLSHNRLANSSFHELFHLNEVEDALFQLVYDDYPHVRIYALK